MFYIILYLVAIVCANILTTIFGPGMSIINAFIFIGFDLTSRDKLHEAWKNKGLVWKMGLLILTGSIISWLLNRNAGIIATASFIAFSCSAIIDTAVYQLLYKKNQFIKINGSNIFSALADSIIFPTIAFGGFSLPITLGQFLAKVGGGFIWSIIIKRKNGKHS